MVTLLALAAVTALAARLARRRALAPFSAKPAALWDDEDVDFWLSRIEPFPLGSPSRK